MAKFCMSCGAPIADGMRFCTACGAPVAEDQPTQQPVQQPEPQTYQPQGAYQQPEQQAYQPQGAYQQPEQQAYQPQGAYQQPEQQAYQPQGAYQQPEQQAYQPYQPQGAYQQPEQQAYQPYQPQGAYQQPQYPQQPAPKKKKTGLIIGIIAGAVLLTAGIIIALVLILGKAAGGGDQPTPGGQIGGGSTTEAPQPGGGSGGGAVSGSSTAPDASVFFYLTPSETTNSDGSTDYLYSVNGRFAVENYMTLLTGAEFSISGDYATVFYNGGGVEYSMPSMYEFLVRVPAGVDYSVTEPPVTLEYLDNNSITAAKWLTLGSQYCTDGINYCSNTPANLRSGCFIATQGNYFYFTDYTDSGKIYRMDLTTSEVTAVVDTKTYGLDLGVAGDYLFYSARQNSDSPRDIYRANINTTSSSLEMFLQGASDPQVYGDWLYYVDASSDAFCRCRLDGSDKQTLITNRGYYTTVAYDKIYTCDYNGEVGIHSFDLDGSNHEYVIAADCWGLSVHGGYFFYSTSPSSGGYIYRLDLDGSNQTLISTIQTISNSSNTTRIVCDGEFIYFNSANSELCFAPVNGSSDAGVLTTDCTSVMVIETDANFMLFYVNSNGDLLRYDMSAGDGVIW